jgi:hypothetical protein
VAGVTKLLQFFSTAALTQVVLMLSQLILLPIQIRLWGHSATAAWYSAVALAAITTVVDCGLRTAGHAELMRCTSRPADELDARDYFRQVWAWIRILVSVVTVLLIAGDCFFTTMILGHPYPFWKAALILAYALETVLIIRIMYLDTLGFYRGAEVSYFIFAALRLALAVPALLLLRLGTDGLAWLFLLTSALALALQGRLLCRRITLLSILAAPPRKLSFRILAVARHTVAEPCANWVRLSLPVLVIAAISTPAAVNTYVALRAAFGAGRTTIQQLSRVASVEYLRFRADGRSAAAESLLSIFVALAGLIGTGVAAFIVADNMRILGLWLAHFDRSLFQNVALSFALSAAFYSYQIVLGLMFRIGELAWIARRHWAYVIYSALFAALASGTKSLPLYLIALPLSETLLSISFLVTGSTARIPFGPEPGRRGLWTGFAGSAVVLLFWLAARQNLGNIFATFSRADSAWTALVLLCVLGAFAFSGYLSSAGLLRTVSFRFARSSPPAPPNGTNYAKSNI